jgi:GT2 family glycosyltransferase
MPPDDPPGRSRPALCLINYNGSVYLASTLARVHEIRDQFSEIVFVDDASTDDSVVVARTLLPDARIIVLPRNRGPGVARNAGLACVESDRVLFMDNDVELASDAVAKLMGALDGDGQAVIAMPRIVSAGDPEHIEYEGGEAHFSGLMRLRGAGDTVGTRPPEPASVGSLVSCCFLFDGSVWSGGQLFDEAFHMYFEDHELGLRARMLGHDLLAVPDAVGLHGRGTPGVSIRATGRYSQRRIVGTIQHRWQLMLKLYQTRTLLLLSPYLILFETFQLAGAVALGWGRPWLSALGGLLGSLGDILRSRVAFKAKRRRPDRVVLTGGPHPFNPALDGRPVVRLATIGLDAFARLNWTLARAFLADGAHP